MARRAGRVVLLLPPSEGKAEGGGRTPWDPDDGVFGAALGSWRLQVVEALTAAGGGDEKLLGVGGRHLLRAQAANTMLLGAPSLPAWKRYTGVVWDHFDVASLPPAARKKALTSVVIPSGLLGVVALGDPTPDYRLKMGARLAPLGLLAAWWRRPLSAVLDEHLTGATVLDLLPQEHAAAWAPTPEGRFAVLKVGFVERSGVQRRMSAHDSKAAKGLLARHLVLTGGDIREALASFEHERFAVQIT